MSTFDLQKIIKDLSTDKPDIFDYRIISKFFNDPQNGRVRKKTYIKGLNEILKEIPNSDRYEFSYNESLEKYGVYEYVGKHKVWSWINTIETHDGIFAIFINAINILCDKKIIDGDVIYVSQLDKYQHTIIKRVLEFISTYRNEIFNLDGSNKKIYRDCKIGSDFTWVRSKLEEIAVIRQTPKVILSETTITKERGDGDDYYRNQDFVLDGKTCQHGIMNVDVNNDDTIEFRKSNINKKDKSSIVDLIYILDKRTGDTFIIDGVFVLENYESLLTERGTIKVPSNAILNIIYKETDDKWFNTLYEVFNLCNKNNIFFDVFNPRDGVGPIQILHDPETFKINYVIFSFKNHHIEEIGDELFNVRDQLLDVLN